MSETNDLNDRQRSAVQYDGGHLLIVAGPGTGKTHTLTHRIVRILNNVDKKILAVTFTNKAAQEMRQRLEAKLPQLWWSITVGTFHRFALSLLREFSEYTPLPQNFQIALPEDIQGFLEEIFPHKTPAQRRETVEGISLLKSTSLVIDANQDYQRYHRFLRSQGLIDFDDILRETLILLENEEIACKVRQRYPYIFVDEYQDINIVQNALLKCLTTATPGVAQVIITAIGDPNQSIYGFRGSQVTLFHRFQEDFPGAKVMQLNENYRSTANLLTASTQVIQGGTSATSGVAEVLAKIIDQGRLVIHEAASDRAEAEYVAHQIEMLVGGVSMFSQDSKRVETYRQAHRSFGDIAILYRLNAQRNVIIEALEHLGIPYVVSSRAEACPPRRAFGETGLARTGPACRTPTEGLSTLSQEAKDDALLQQFEESLSYNVEKVSLLTLHAAKGLEFPVVFIVGCEAKLLPLDLHDMKGDPQEERRLFYVGMTRAKEHLYLTRAGRRQLFGQTFFNPPSLFLADIEEDLKVYENSRLRRRLSKSKEAEKQQLKLF